MNTNTSWTVFGVSTLVLLAYVISIEVFLSFKEDKIIKSLIEQGHNPLIVDCVIRNNTNYEGCKVLILSKHNVYK